MIVDAMLLFVAAFAAGALNAVAGGGSFLTLPALVVAGLPAVAANATGTLALLPGYLSGAWALRREIRPLRGLSLSRLVAVSLLGGGMGALLLLWTSNEVFRRIVPWLLLLATVLFAIGPGLMRRPPGAGAAPAVALAAIFAVTIYGGYFNGGLGILLLAAFGLLGQSDLHAANGMKNLISALLTAIASLLYVAGGLIHWPQALWMMAAATLGGYAGARLSRRVPVRWLRWGIVFVGLAMSAAFFCAEP